MVRSDTGLFTWQGYSIQMSSATYLRIFSGWILIIITPHTLGDCQCWCWNRENRSHCFNNSFLECICFGMCLDSLSSLCNRFKISVQRLKMYSALPDRSPLSNYVTKTKSTFVVLCFSCGQTLTSVVSPPDILITLTSRSWVCSNIVTAILWGY